MQCQLSQWLPLEMEKYRLNMATNKKLKCLERLVGFEGFFSIDSRSLDQVHLDIAKLKIRQSGWIIFPFLERVEVWKWLNFSFIFVAKVLYVSSLCSRI